MTYQQIDRITHGREPRHNEYFDIDKNSYGVITHYGLYDVTETFLRPDGKVQVLGVKHGAMTEYVIGTVPETQGQYTRDSDQARQFFAWEIARSFNLVVLCPGSKGVAHVDMQALGVAVKKVDDTVAAKTELLKRGGADSEEYTAADNALEDAAEELTDKIKGLNLTRPPFTTSERA